MTGEARSHLGFELDVARLSGRVAVVTGASRGLGAGLAARLAEHGMAIGVCARHEPSVRSAAGTVAAACDVADAEQMERFAARVVDELGPIALWVNNAGLLEPMGPLRDADPAAVDAAVTVNVAGVAHGTRSFLRAVRGQDRGDVRPTLVNVSSGAATSVYEGWAIYGATKAAVDQLTRVVAREEPDLRICSVSPGVVDTDMQAAIRATDEHAFPLVGRFRDLHEHGDFNSPAWVADHLAGLLLGAYEPGDVVVRVPNEPHGS